MTTPTPLPQPFIPLSSPQAALESVGGKGLNLVKLVNAGFPVPDGFLIPTSAYCDFVMHNDLDARISEILQNLDPTSPEDLTAASEEIRTRFVRGSVPQRLIDALGIGYRWLGEQPVAVRSSATAEDLPDLSFAGQQDTFLNVIGERALLEAVIKCWSSLWTARAIGYRARNGISHEQVSLAVVVQKMVQSQASGVLFTANPLTGKRTETVIDATLGLGEALVGGQVEPDHYVVETESDSHLKQSEIAGDRHFEMAISHKFLGSKSLIISGKSEGGVISQEADSSQKQAIPDEVILELAKIGKEIEVLYDFPQDIEWAWEDPSPLTPLLLGERGKLHILQSRPITSLFPLPANLPPEPLKLLIGLHVIQGVLEPFTPLGQDTLMWVLTGVASLFRLEYTLETQTALYLAAERIFINFTPILRTPQGHRAFPKVFKYLDPGVAAAAAAVIDEPQFAPIKLKLRLNTIRRVAYFALPVLGQIILALRNPERRAREVLQIFDEKIATTQSRQATRGDLWDDYARRLQMIHEAKTVFSDLAIPKGIPPIIASMASFIGILQRFGHEAAQATGDSRFQTIHMEIARGLPNNVTTEMDLKLWQTAQTLREDPDSLQIFEGGVASELAASFMADSLPQVAQTALDHFMKEYGVRGLGEIDIGRKRWREDPTPVMQVLQSYLQISDPEQAPDAVFGRGAEAAKVSAETLIDAVRHLPGGRFKARFVRFALRRYRALAGLREAPKFFAIRMMGIMRAGLLASGEEFVQAGMLEQADDLFFMRIAELDQILEQKNISEEIRVQVVQRRAIHARELRRVQIPRVMLSDGSAYYGGMSAPDDDSNAIVGDPVSPGVVEGIVRVVFDPQRAQLEPGEILVCPGTDPAWTPLFLAAGGLVMEVGGMMTHGSVVAREYGIPAVVGVHQATTRLQTGQKIRVDGSTGVVTVIGEP
jgi:phosphohistidine swiveling domain-containing protein